jgi:hypothetical protein
MKPNFSKNEKKTLRVQLKNTGNRAISIKLRPDGSTRVTDAKTGQVIQATPARFGN